MTAEQALNRIDEYQKGGIHISTMPDDDGAGWFCSVCTQEELRQGNPPYKFFHTQYYAHPLPAIIEGIQIVEEHFNIKP